MKPYPYLRAYMAGITVPTIFLIFVMTVFAVARYVLNVPFSIERIIVFPMAIVPNLWGLWNILYVRLRPFRYLPIGFHGALLAIVQATIFFVLTRLQDFEIPQFVANAFPFTFPVMIAVFYLVWKHIVAFLNAIMGID